MSSKPDKVKETLSERLSKQEAARTAQLSERILSSAAPSLARLSDKKFGDVATGRANADVNQQFGVTRFSTDPSRGIGVGGVGGRNLARRGALSRTYNEAKSRAMGVEDTLTSNLVASGTDTIANTQSGLNGLANFSANDASRRAQIPGTGQAVFNGLTDIGSSLISAKGIRDQKKFMESFQTKAGSQI